MMMTLNPGTLRNANINTTVNVCNDDHVPLGATVCSVINAQLLPVQCVLGIRIIGKLAEKTLSMYKCVI